MEEATDEAAKVSATSLSGISALVPTESRKVNKVNIHFTTQNYAMLRRVFRIIATILGHFSPVFRWGHPRLTAEKTGEIGLVIQSYLHGNIDD